jgi:hypothetical protein
MKQLKHNQDFFEEWHIAQGWAKMHPFGNYPLMERIGIYQHFFDHHDLHVIVDNDPQWHSDNGKWAYTITDEEGGAIVSGKETFKTRHDALVAGITQADIILNDYCNPEH